MKKFLLLCMSLLFMATISAINYHSSDQLKTAPFCIVQTGTQSLNFVATFEQNYAPPVIFCFQSKMISQVPKIINNAYPIYIANIGYRQNEIRFNFSQSINAKQSITYTLNQYRKNVLLSHRINYNQLE